MSTFTWDPVRSVEECNAILTGPGQYHELECAIIEGRVYRTYKNLWRSVREFWLSSVSNNFPLHERDYIVFENFRLTYGQVDELVHRAASVFREVYGIRKGDRVGIAMRNYPEWIISFFAAGLLGAVPTLFNAWLPIEPFLHCIKLTTPKLLIVDSERLKLLVPHMNALPLSVIIVRPSSPKLEAIRGIKEWTKALSSYSGFLKAWEKEPSALPDDDATIFFTSGTTGLPKGVLSSQRGFLGNIFNASYAVRRRELRLGQDLPPPIGSGTPPDVVKRFATLIVVPLFHVTGCTSQLLTATTNGSKVALMRKWDKEEAAKLIVKEGITSVSGVPSITYDLMDSSAVGNTGLLAVGTGGAPAADSLVREIVQKFPNAVTAQGYGLSETNSVAVSVVGEDYRARPGSTGLPPAPVDLLVVDPDSNKVLPRGQIGELWIRGPNVMLRYYNNPKATVEAVTRDGWLKSGDLAIIDEEGFVYIKDRVKDMIIRGGENIHSVTVENALFSDERVLDCAAVGIPDKRLGELVGAVVVPRQEWIGKLSEGDLLQKIGTRLPAFAIPSIILVQSETLDRNAAGKTLKRNLRKTLVKEWKRRNRIKGKL